MIEQQKKTKRISVNKIRIIGFTVLIGVVFLIIFLSKEWDMIQMKRGESQAPILWETSYATDDVMLIEQDDKRFEELKVSITDLFYRPEVKRMHFGLWYDSSDYDKENVPKHVFQIKLVDEEGNEFDNEVFAFGRNGIFGQFQFRQISDIQLNNVDKLYMEIYPVVEENGEIIELSPERKLVYSNSMQPLSKYGHHVYNN